MQNEELDLLPGIERSAMEPFLNMESLVTLYEGNGVPENRTFTDKQQEAMDQAFRSK